MLHQKKTGAALIIIVYFKCLEKFYYIISVFRADVGERSFYSAGINNVIPVLMGHTQVFCININK